MGKSLYIAEKPSVARQFGDALGESLSKRDGFLEGPNSVVTWCVGHLVTMSYPEVYDEALKKWSLETLPFLPKEYKYEVIKSAAKQYAIVANLLNRDDISTIYVATDSGREGEYIYRLVEQEANVTGKERKRVWIDSQTEEEILRGIREAKDLSEYDALSDSAYCRAKEDYLMGINFSRLLTLRYGYNLRECLGEEKGAIAVGRVMTCVLGMVVKREREIRDFVKTPFYKVSGTVDFDNATIPMEWRATPESVYNNSPKLYGDKGAGFNEREDAIALINQVSQSQFTESSFDEDGSVSAQAKGVITKVEKKKEKKNPPLLYNLAELQNDCSKFFKISPNETLAIVQELYEKKMVTYPRTDARVLSTAVAKEISKNISGLQNLNMFPKVPACAKYILEKETYKNIAKTKYVNDKQITDHYAIIPTGAGLSAINGLNPRALNVYETIVRRFLAIFLPAAVYEKCNLTVVSGSESFFATSKYLMEPGFLAGMEYSFKKKKDQSQQEGQASEAKEENEEDSEENNADIGEIISRIKKGDEVDFTKFAIKEGETSPPKRYNSGSLILAMENAGNLIEDEELREQIKGSGIGTSATRAGILEKLVNIKYLNLNKKTQIITPSLKGEMINDIVYVTIPALLNPDLTASWEKGLTMVADGDISSDEYMEKLEGFVTKNTDKVKATRNRSGLQSRYNELAVHYKK